MWPNPQFSADLVTFTGEILNGKLLFLCDVIESKIVVMKLAHFTEVVFAFFHFHKKIVLVTKNLKR